MAMPKPKPNYLLEITADMQFVESLAPQAGCDDPKFYYNFNLRCKKCKKYFRYQLCINLKSRPFEKPCEYCGEPGSVALVPGFGKPLTADCAYESKYSPLMAFEIKGYEPVDFFFESGWKAESVNGTVFNNVDLSNEYWAKCKYGIPASISLLDYRFTLLDNDGGRVNKNESDEKEGTAHEDFKDDYTEEGKLPHVKGTDNDDGRVNKNEDFKDEDTAHEDFKDEDTAHEDFKDDYTDEDEVDENFRCSEFQKHEDDEFESGDYNDDESDEE